MLKPLTIALSVSFLTFACSSYEPANETDTSTLFYKNDGRLTSNQEDKVVDAIRYAALNCWTGPTSPFPDQGVSVTSNYKSDVYTFDNIGEEILTLNVAHFDDVIVTASGRDVERTFGNYIQQKLRFTPLNPCN